MRSTWRLSDTPSLPAGTWEFEDVYLEFNGPQLGTVRDGGHRYLAVASDEDDDAERWLKVRVSDTELAALLDGATSIGDVFRKPVVSVVDISFSQGVPVREWHVHPKDLTDRDLPEPTAMLPSDARAPRIAVVGPVLTLDGLEAPSHTIQFESLGDVLKNFQRIWNALAQAVVGATTQRGIINKELLAMASLSAAALSPGSVKVQIEPADQDLFGSVADRYARLVAANEDEHELFRELRDLKVRVRSTYRDLLETLSRHNVQAYMAWDTQRVFIGPYKANRIRQKLFITEQADEDQMIAEGFFTAVNIRSGSFEFCDSFDSGLYSGTVDAGAFQEHSVVVGPDASYSVRVSVLTLDDSISGPSYRYKLLSATRIGAPKPDRPPK